MGVDEQSVGYHTRTAPRIIVDRPDVPALILRWYQLNLLVPYHSDPMRAHGSNALLASILLPEVLEFGRSPAAVDGNVLRHMGSALIDVLVDHFIDACAQLATRKAAEITQLGEFLAALREDFDIGIVTLNYDNVFTQACPDLYIPAHNVKQR